MNYPPALPAFWQPPKRYLHIAFNFPPVWAPMQTAVQNVITANALDWLRYAANCWIVWTTENSKQWADKFYAQVQGAREGSFLIVAIDISATSDGWANFPQWIWDWIRRYRS